MASLDRFKDGYASYAGFSDYSYKCITYLMDNEELVWKLLKYDKADAWTESDLTKDEKAALIYAGQPNSADFRVFMDSGNPDVIVAAISQLRIYPLKVLAETRTQGAVLMAFEVYCHYKINQLSNYKTRIDLLVQQLIGVFNGASIAGMGRLHFNALETSEDRVLSVGQIPHKGKVIYMSNKDT